MAGESNFVGFTAAGQSVPVTLANNRVVVPTSSAQAPLSMNGSTNAAAASGAVVTLQNAPPCSQNGYYPGSPATGSYLVSQSNGVLTYYAEQKSQNGAVDSLMNGHCSPQIGSDNASNATASATTKTTYLTDQLNMEQDSQTSNIGTLLMDMNTSSSPSASSSLAVASLATYASIGVDEQFDSGSLGNGTSSLPPVSTFNLPNFRNTNYWWEQNEYKPATTYAAPVSVSSVNGTTGPPNYFGAFPATGPTNVHYSQYPQYNGTYHADTSDYSSLTSLTSTLTN